MDVLSAELRHADRSHLGRCAMELCVSLLVARASRTPGTGNAISAYFVSTVLLLRAHISAGQSYPLEQHGTSENTAVAVSSCSCSKGPGAPGDAVRAASAEERRKRPRSKRASRRAAWSQIAARRGVAASLRSREDEVWMTVVRRWRPSHPFDSQP